MPQLNGIEATREITEHYPRTRVVALSMQKDGVYVREMLKAGARAYVLKDCTEYDLVSAVRAVALGNAWLSPDVVSIVIDDYRRPVPEPIDLLSPREREVLQMIAEGKSNKDIGVQLNLSVYTVEAHRGRLMEKLNLHSGTELVRFAVRQGMVA
jgi:DNA-binding NarL/FixJ family response regulator